MEEGARGAIVRAFGDAEAHKTTVLCALGQALIAAATLVAVAPWAYAGALRAVIVADLLHVLPIVVLAGLGYVALHLGKCLSRAPAPTR
jgi:hypothetical protein